MIYLDNAATTKMSEEALKEYEYFSCSNFYNPSATYLPAIKVAMALDEARARLKKCLGAKKGDIIFTSGATESNNLAIRGSLREGKWEYVFSSGEHASVYNLANALKREGKTVNFIPLFKTGEIDYDALEKMLSPKTRIVSVMFVNNVTGVINDIKKISEIVRKNAPSAILHVDGVQAFCKLNFNLDELDVDLFSISAHKFHGPKGVGALYVKNKATLKNLVYGGGQEYGIRSGTENVPAIMAMVKASELINTQENFEKVLKLKGQFLDEIKKCDKIKVVGENTSPYIAMLLFDGVNGETLTRALENQIIVGRGSACSAKKAGNHVLEAMGYKINEIKGAIRVSFDASLTHQQIKEAAEIIIKTYNELLEKLK